MPKHSFSPPFKSTLVVSRSKDFEKHMTTIPKPIILSKWQSWNMKLIGENKLHWFPSEYDNILNHLVAKWIKISKDVFEKMKDDERKLIFVYYNPDNNLTNVKTWDIKVKDLDATWSKHRPYSSFKGSKANQ